MIALKISLGIFFLRIVIRPWEKRVVYVCLAVSTVFGIAYFFFAVCQCGMTKDSFEFWTKLISNKCVTPAQVLGVSYTHAILTTVTDWIYAVLPIPMLHKSQLARREKVIVGLILVLGAM
jgi:hypothetical protein